MKKIAVLILLIASLLAGLFLARNALAKVLIEQVVKAVTGLPLHLGGLDVNVAGEFVKVDDLKLFNPAGFPEEPMVSIPEIYVAYDLAATLKGTLHFRELRFEMEEFSVVRNEQGVLNLDKLKSLANSSPTAAPAAPAKKIPVQIDSFTLRVGQVLFKDYSGARPSVKKFQVNLVGHYRDISDMDALVRLIIAKALMNTSIATLTNFDLAGLQSSVTDIAGNSVKLAGDMAGKSLDELSAKAGNLGNLAKNGKILQDTGEAGGEVVSEAGSAAKGAADLVKSKTSSLVGGLTSKFKSL